MALWGFWVSFFLERAGGGISIWIIRHEFIWLQKQSHLTMVWKNQGLFFLMLQEGYCWFCYNCLTMSLWLFFSCSSCDYFMIVIPLGIMSGLKVVRWGVMVTLVMVIPFIREVDTFPEYSAIGSCFGLSDHICVNTYC